MDDSEPMQVDLVDDVNDNDNNEAHHVQPFIPLNALLGQQGTEVQADFVVENPTLDLESYANSYTGMAKLQRLIHIADHCPSLKVDALKMALTYVTQTCNVEMYQKLHKKLRGPGSLTPPEPGQGQAGQVQVQAAPAGPGEAAGIPGPAVAGIPPIDSQWIDATTKRSAVMLDKLDGELKNHKANSIKESIRRGYDDLGEFYLECGDLMNAWKSFTRSRDYCTSAKHVIQMCLNIIKVSVYLQNWAHVSNYVIKAENTPDPSDDKKVNAKEAGQINAKLKCAMGLSDLALKKYKCAARSFLRINFDHMDCPDLMSQSNVAVYAALCALASFTRKELQEEVISSSSFKLFLELEPPIREVIHSFYDSKYGKCLQLLDEMKENFLLDLYLAPHVNALYCQIRSRGLIQYFAPYASADMNRMAESFNTTVPMLENELMALILSGAISARIDSQNKVLYIQSEDKRTQIFEKALKLGDEYERKTKLMILRTAMLRAHISVKNPAKEDGDARRSGTGTGTGQQQFNNHL